MSKLQILIENEGYKDMDSFIADAAYDSSCPGICMNDGCDYSTEVEPDQNRGWCEECNTKSVKSGLMLAGIY